MVKRVAFDLIEDLNDLCRFPVVADEHTVEIEQVLGKAVKHLFFFKVETLPQILEEADIAEMGGTLFLRKGGLGVDELAGHDPDTSFDQLLHAVGADH